MSLSEEGNLFIKHSSYEMNFPLINKTLKETLIEFIPEDLIKICQYFYDMISKIYKNTSFKYFNYHDIYLDDTLFNFVYDDIKKLIDNKIIEIIREQMHQYLKNSYYERMIHTYKEPDLNVHYQIGLLKRINNWQYVPTKKRTIIISEIIDISEIITNNKSEKPFTLINKPSLSRRQAKLTFPKKQNYYPQKFKTPKQNKRNFGSGK